MVRNVSGIESVIWDDWFPVAELVRLEQVGVFETTLLGVKVRLVFSATDARVQAFAGSEPIAHLQTKYGFVWICLGQPLHDDRGFRGMP